MTLIVGRQQSSAPLLRLIYSKPCSVSFMALRGFLIVPSYLSYVHTAELKNMRRAGVMLDTGTECEMRGW